MGIWKINVENSIKIVSDTPNFSIQYYNGVDFIDFPNPVKAIDNILYLVNHTFVETGNYIIKLKDLDNGDVRYNEITVLNENEVMLQNTEYAVEYSGSKLVFN